MYAVLHQVGYYPVKLVSNALAQLLAPIRLDRAAYARDPLWTRAVHRPVSQSLVFVLPLTVVASVLAAAFHKLLVPILVVSKHGDGFVLQPLAVLGGGLFACGQVAIPPLLSEQRTTTLGRPEALTALAAIAMNVIGIRLIGVPRVVASVVLFGLGCFGWVQFDERRRANEMSP